MGWHNVAISTSRLRGRAATSLSDGAATKRSTAAVVRRRTVGERNCLAGIARLGGDDGQEVEGVEVPGLERERLPVEFSGARSENSQCGRKAFRETPHCQ